MWWLLAGITDEKSGLLAPTFWSGGIESMTLREVLYWAGSYCLALFYALLGLLTQLVNIILFNTSWLDAPWYLVLIAVSLYWYAAVKIKQMLKWLWQRFVPANREILVTDIIVLFIPSLILVFWVYTLIVG